MRDQALRPAEVNRAPGEKFSPENRKWQGIPGLERTKNGRLYAAFYSGGEGEGPDNYVLLISSDDGGASWAAPVLAVDPPGKVRAFDPCLWIDPAGALWLFWAQSYEFFDGRAGVWAIKAENPDAKQPSWSEPRRVANGVMMNKPTVLSSGEWLLPCAVWGIGAEGEYPGRIEAERSANLYVSTDGGESFELFKGPDFHNLSFDEHMVVERGDGSLWLLARTDRGIAGAQSFDRGKTWVNLGITDIKSPDARFFIRKLASGRLLLVNHYNFTGRNNLAAAISDDGGATWHGFLMLDERDNVSYPDGVQAEDGLIYIIYDRERYKDKELFMAVFTEEDAAAGKDVSGRCAFRVPVGAPAKTEKQGD